MKEIEATRLKLKAMEMVEGTGLSWWQAVKNVVTNRAFISPPNFADTKEDYELALGIIEGMPLWAGNKYYDAKGQEWIAMTDIYRKDYLDTCTWLPPKPKTATIELPIGDIEYWGSIGERYQESLDDVSLRLYNASRKTLEQLAPNAPRDGNKYLETSWDDGKTAGFTREKLK